MKKAIVFLILMIPFLSNGQKIKRNEIGLGIGHIQYNTPLTKMATFYNSITSTVPFVSLKYFNTDKSGTQARVNFKTSPIIYYSYRLSKKLSIRINFQYFNVSSNNILKVQLDDVCYGNYNLVRKTLNTNLGIEHTLLNKKHKQLYWGVELNYEKGTQHEIGNGRIAWSGKTVSINQKSKYLMGGLNGLIGTKFNVLKNLNAKIEASLFITDGFGIRPINRLSLNYQF
jgi:hypothetical protein